MITHLSTQWNSCFPIRPGVGDTAGIKVFANAFTDGVSAINTVRWDAPYMAGTVEARGVSLVYLKDED